VGRNERKRIRLDALGSRQGGGEGARRARRAFVKRYLGTGLRSTKENLMEGKKRKEKTRLIWQGSASLAVHKKRGTKEEISGALVKRCGWKEREKKETSRAEPRGRTSKH